MAAPFALEGKPQHGLLQNGLYAAIILTLPLLIVNKQQLGGGPPGVADAVFGAIFAAFGMGFLIAALKAIGRRRLEINDLGVRLFVRGRPAWALTWDQVSEIGTHAVSFRYAMAGFYLRVGNRRRWVTDVSAISPWMLLKPAFREVATQLQGRPVVLNDQLHWAPGMAAEFLRPGGVAEPALLAAEETWTRRVAKVTHAFLALAVVGSLCIAWPAVSLFLPPSSAARSIIQFMAPLWVMVGAFCLVVGFLSQLGAPIAIRVDRFYLGMEFWGGRIKNLPWSEVAYCSMGVTPGDLGVGFRGSIRGWSARFPPATAQAARRRWREANALAQG